MPSVTVLRACPAIRANTLREAVRVALPGFLAAQSMVSSKTSWWAVISRRRRRYRPRWAIAPAWYGLRAVGIVQAFLRYAKAGRGAQRAKLRHCKKIVSC